MVLSYIEGVEFLRIQNILNEMEYELKKEILQNRSVNFKQKNLTSEDVEKKVFQVPILTAQEAVDTG